MEQQTVFIVDDDAAVRDSIQELVESVGLCAQSYASGQAFLDSFQPQRSGCLVVDVRMAGMSGLLLQQKLGDWERGFRSSSSPATLMCPWPCTPCRPVPSISYKNPTVINCYWTASLRHWRQTRLPGVRPRGRTTSIGTWPR